MPRFVADKITFCRVVGAFPVTFQCLIADNMLDVCMFRLSFLTRVIADDRVQFLQSRVVNGRISVQVGPGTLIFQGYVCMYVCSSSDTCMCVHPATCAYICTLYHVELLYIKRFGYHTVVTRYCYFKFTQRYFYVHRAQATRMTMMSMVYIFVLLRGV